MRDITAMARVTTIVIKSRADNFVLHLGKATLTSAIGISRKARKKILFICGSLFAIGSFFFVLLRGGVFLLTLYNMTTSLNLGSCTVTSLNKCPIFVMSPTWDLRDLRSYTMTSGSATSSSTFFFDFFSRCLCFLCPSPFTALLSLLGRVRFSSLDLGVDSGEVATPSSFASSFESAFLLSFSGLTSFLFALLALLECFLGFSSFGLSVLSESLSSCLSSSFFSFFCSSLDDPSFLPSLAPSLASFLSPPDLDASLVSLASAGFFFVKYLFLA
mmetsp:Transcript_14995/g.16678  ORF Transcript_14995/g.16678 Transcript_14995/m.16678 type:complete len:273 (-) Transcript_14995:724-1542(-)